MKNNDVVKGIYEAFGKGDVPAVLGALDPGVEWYEAEGHIYADKNPYMGPQRVAEGVFMRIMSEIDNFTATPENFVDGGDTVVAEGRYRGTMKATGAPIDAQFAHVWHLRGGKVVRFQQYTDTVQWAKASAAAR